MTATRIREEEVTDLTVKNAHRVILIREKGKADAEPVPFHFRKIYRGMHHYAHLYGNPDDNNELLPADFGNWEVVVFKHPAYLEDMWQQACDAYNWSSFEPNIRGESDIMIYEEELYNDLACIPEGRREEYVASYRCKLAAQLSALSRCTNPMTTGWSRFDIYEHAKAEMRYQKRYEEFRSWRERTLKAVNRAQEDVCPEEKREKARLVLKRYI